MEKARVMLRETIQEYREHNPLFSPNDTPRDKALLKRLETPLTRWDQVASFNALMSPNFRSLLQGVWPRDSKPTCFQFSQGDSGWYFMYANFGSSAITFVVFRLPVISPRVTKNHGLGMDETCVYMVSGYLNQGDTSNPINFVVPANPPTEENGYCNYECIGSSEMTMTIQDGQGTKIKWSGSPSLNQMNLVITSKSFDVNLQLNSSKARVWNGPGGCTPACVAGVGSLYWSYTTLDVQGKVQGSEVKGQGWFDHQWESSARPNSWILRLIDNLSHVGKPISPFKWNWLTIQLPEVQYMITVFYDSTSPKKGHTYKAAIANRYGVDSKVIRVEANVQIKEFTTQFIPEETHAEEIEFPTVVVVHVDGKTFTLENKFTAPSLIRLGGQLNWEGIATIKERPDGQGFIESNSFQDDTSVSTATAHIAGIQNVTPFIPRPLSFAEYAPSLFMVIFLILLVLFIVVGIPILAAHYRRKKMKI